MTAMQRGRMPAGWDADLSDEYEWVPLRLPPDLTRISASTRLSIEAEYRGWELTRVRLYTDGSRRVLLRRKKTAVDRPGHLRTSRRCDAVMYRALRRALFLVAPERIHTWVFAVLARRARRSFRCAVCWRDGWRRTIRCWPARCSACVSPARWAWRPASTRTAGG